MAKTRGSFNQKSDSLLPTWGWGGGTRPVFHCVGEGHYAAGMQVKIQGQAKVKSACREMDSKPVENKTELTVL